MPPVYLDCAATTPMEPLVLEEVVRYLERDFGNAGSRTHEYGNAAKRRVQRAREEVANLAHADPAEVLFTSGATESNNLALLGLAQHGVDTNKRHVITTAIEHKAVLEPLEELERRGFEIERVMPDQDGSVNAETVARRVRSDTLLVSVMHANNETGVIQPVEELADLLSTSDAFLHVDAAQTFGKEPLATSRVDLVSISGHKIFGPKGIGALIARRRGFQRPPLRPLGFGGGQERGLRPGTLPVALIAGLGTASELAASTAARRRTVCESYGQRVQDAFAPLKPVVNGSSARRLPHILNVSFAGIDSEAVMVATKDQIAVSNGSACTSQSYAPSHVLSAMGLPPQRISGAVRFSWSHLTEDPDWSAVRSSLQALSPLSRAAA